MCCRRFCIPLIIVFSRTCCCSHSRWPNKRGSIVLTVHASQARGLRVEPDSMPLLNARSLFTQQQMGTQCEHWGDKGGEERNWPPYIICRWLRIRILSNRHSPTHKSVRDCLYFLVGQSITLPFSQWIVSRHIPFYVHIC